MAHWNLIIEDDTGKAMAVPLTRDEVTIGRKEGNTIRLTERNVSRFHAKLKKVDGAKVHIEDLGSYNGIKINGDKIAGQVEIREGDLIEIGDYHLALQAVGMSETADALSEPTIAPAGAPGPLSLQTTQGAPAEDENDEFAGDTQRWEPPVGMEPVAVGMATVDDQAALADGLLSPQNVSGIGSPTLDERPALSSSSPSGSSASGSDGSHATGNDPEATVRNQSAPILPAPGTPIGDISGDDTEAIPVARSDAPTITEARATEARATEARATDAKAADTSIPAGGEAKSPSATPAAAENVAAAAPVSAMASLAGIEDEPTEAHPTSGSIGSGASGSPISGPSTDVTGTQDPPFAPPTLLPKADAAQSPAASGVAGVGSGTGQPVADAALPATAPEGTPAVRPQAPDGAAPSAAPPKPNPPPAAAMAPKSGEGQPAFAAPQEPAAADGGQAGPPPPKSSGEYTDIVRAAPGPRKQQTDTPRLVVLNSVFAGSIYALQADELVIGRIEDNDVTIEHRSVSRHHAKVVKEGNGYRIVDLGSANGILLNGLETDGAVLKSGDVIELGRIRIRFVPAGEAFELTSEEIARARKADALGEDDFEDGPQTAFINTNAPAAVAENGNGSTVVILIAAAFVIILLLVVIVFLLLRPPSDADVDPSDPAPTVALNAGSGDRASGDSASGDSASGDSASGDNASGDSATGDSASGDSASGDSASGDSATGDSATGDNATGDSATGDSATGDSATGDSATGDSATGDSATGDSASGDSASGDSASGDSAAAVASNNPADDDRPSEADKKKREREAARALAAKRRADRKRRAQQAGDNITEARKLFLARKLDLALAKALEADRLKPKDGSIHRFIGAIYLEKKNKAKAKRHFQLALRYRPNADWADHTREQLAGL